MNPQVEADMKVLIDDADEETRPLVARLLDLVEEYESGDFSRGWGETMPPGLSKRLSPKALIALMRVYHYLNELIRVRYDQILAQQRDSSKQGDSE